MFKCYRQLSGGKRGEAHTAVMEGWGVVAMSGRILNKYERQMENKMKPLFTDTEYLTLSTPTHTLVHVELNVLLLMCDNPAPHTDWLKLERCR